MQTNLLSLAVNQSILGNNTLVSLAANETLKVYEYNLLAAGSVTVKFMSGTADITGPMSMIVGVPNEAVAPSLPATRVPLFSCTPGNNLTMNMSANVSVGGHMVYEKFTP